MKYLKKNSKFYIIPLVFIVTFIPLIVYLKRIELGSFLAQYWTGDVNMDFFSYHKSMWLIVASLVGLILFLIYLSKGNKFKKTKYYIPIGVYVIFTLFSSIFSKTPFVSFLGFPDRYEGLFVLLSYMLLMILAINLINDKKTVKIIVVALLISAIILGVQGIFQYFGMDFFRTDVGRKLMLPGEYHNLVDKLNFKFGKNIIYSTMFNPNYVGSYTAMLLGLTLALYVLIKDHKYKIMLGIISCIMFAYWLGSMSRAGMLGGFFAVVLLAVLLKDKILDNWKYVLAIFVSFTLILVGMNTYSNGQIMGDLLSFGEETQIAIEGQKDELKDINLKEKEVTIKMADNDITARLDGSSLLFLTEQDQQIPYQFNKENGDVTLTSDLYQDHEFNFSNESNVLKWQYGNNQAFFKITKNGFYIVGHNDKAYKMQEVEAWGFEDKLHLGSNRGYIWSRSLPLLKDTWFLGYGADTYAINFPQKDWVGKIKAFGKTTKIVDKPHNMYLQTAINTGIPSLLALLVLFGMYFYQSVKLYWKNKYDDFYSIVGVGILAAFIGYTIAGLFNDSVVSVAPVFWILLGMGISINLKLKSNEVKDT